MNLEKLQPKAQLLCLHCGNDRQGLLWEKELGNISLVQLKKKKQTELNIYKMHLVEGFALEQVKL